ncbi:MAG: transporter substrate-binding domain-containing protein [Deltaproteobacteria bacterium]|nr:transporter substrate-binding domain-containing protein [Deltaproteobacteria bacterium]
MTSDRGKKHYFYLFLYLSISFFTHLYSVIPSAQAAEKTVRVGIYENAPKVFTSESGKPSGIFIDIIESIAKDEGWRLQYVPGTWGEGLDRLIKGEIDLMPDVVHTSDRENIYSFHKVPVLTSWFQVYARKGSGIKSILDLHGKRITVLERSVQQEAFTRLAESFELKSIIIPLPDYQTIFERIVNGEADAAITNRFHGLVHAKKYGLEDTAIIFYPSELYFAAPKGANKNLLIAIDRHLTILKKNPQSIYYDSLKRWTSEDIQFKLPAWTKTIGMITGIILLTSLAVSIFLKHQVKKRIREINEMNEMLRASEKKYRELVMSANSIILRWTRDGRITFLNEFGQRFFGYTEKEILGRHVVGTIVPETESTGRDLRPLMEDILADPKKIERNINENMRRNGELVWIEWTNKIVLDEQNQIKEIMSIGLDITDRKHAEEEIHSLHNDLQRHAENLEKRVQERTAELAVAKEKAESADRLKSAFLATMSHELRTPLNSIIGFTGIMIKELAGPLNQEQHKQLGMVQNSSRHLLALINDVLDISKIEAGQLDLFLSSFELRQSIEAMTSLVSPLAEKKGLDLKVEIANDVERVTTDQRRLEQIILNLLNNAVKFTETGYVAVSCERGNGEYILSVTDTGIGIGEEEIPKLFHPFHQVDTGLARKHEGTGLGLSICRKLINIMSGSIDVRSQMGQGSTFTIRLPIEKGGSV